MRTEIKLQIAGIVIAIRSDFDLLKLSAQEKKERDYRRFENFSCPARKHPRIIINVQIVNQLPVIKAEDNPFIVYHFQDKAENWRISKRQGGYVFQSPLEDKKMYVFLSRNFQRAKVYILPKALKGKVWGIEDITDDFLHILLINYLAYNGLGFFAHGVGVRDTNGKGMLFCGKSGAGKSTTAEIWHKHSRAMILNDDRIIVLKEKKGFSIHSAPWHGEFHANFSKKLRPALLERLFFIYHSKNNKAVQISIARAFSFLYSTIFPPFWDKKCLTNTARLCQELLREVKSCRLGFVNDEKVIAFVRGIGEYSADERTGI